MAEASASSVSDTQVPDPNFIRYLFNPAHTFSCYLLVGNPSISPPERIGVVLDMLFAHSEVMRSDLQTLNIKDKTPIKIIDIFPSTFRNLLRYVYGFDTTSTLSFDDADNLLYAAEKYIMPELKDKVATRLMSLLNCDNICSLLNNPACGQALALNAQINKILQYDTKKVFASPHFLELSSDAFVKILQQEALHVQELEIWHKALVWAKHKAKSQDRKSLREVMEKPIKHIRLCTLTPEELCVEVAPMKVLSDEEFRSVCVSVGKKEEIFPDLNNICAQVKPRKFACNKSPILTVSSHNTINALTTVREANKRCTFILETYELGVELSSFTVDASYFGDTLKYDFTVDVERVGIPDVRTRVCFTAHDIDGDVDIPISTEDKHVWLLPRTRHKVCVSSNELFYFHSLCSDVAHFNHFSITPEYEYIQLMKRINYKTVDL